MKGRLLALDTETTGLDILDNTSTKHPYHRITEIGVVEIIDGEITCRKFQTYLNPKREVSIGSYRITGISTEFLQDKPPFEKVVDEFLAFLQNSKLIIHNAKFDMKFLNFELSLVNKKNLDINNVIDTLPMARQKYPGQKASLDALCKRFNIDNSSRVFHGALMDAQLLARVYLYMQGFANQLNLMDFANNSNVISTQENLHNIDNVKNNCNDIAIKSRLDAQDNTLSNLAKFNLANFKVIKPNLQELEKHAKIIENLH